MSDGFWSSRCLKHCLNVHLNTLHSLSLMHGIGGFLGLAWDRALLIGFICGMKMSKHQGRRMERAADRERARPADPTAALQR